MANVVNGCGTNITVVCIVRSTSRSIIYNCDYSQIAFALHIMYIYASHAAVVCTMIRTTQIRIVHATRVDIYTAATAPRTRTSVARTDAGRKRSSPMQLVRDRIAVVVDGLCKLARRDARRSLAAAVVTECGHV